MWQLCECAGSYRLQAIPIQGETPYWSLVIEKVGVYSQRLISDGEFGWPPLVWSPFKSRLLAIGNHCIHIVRYHWSLYWDRMVQISMKILTFLKTKIPSLKSSLLNLNPTTTDTLTAWMLRSIIDYRQSKFETPSNHSFSMHKAQTHQKYTKEEQLNHICQ